MDFSFGALFFSIIFYVAFSCGNHTFTKSQRTHDNLLMFLVKILNISSIRCDMMVYLIKTHLVHTHSRDHLQHTRHIRCSIVLSRRSHSSKRNPRAHGLKIRQSYRRLRCVRGKDEGSKEPERAHRGTAVFQLLIACRTHKRERAHRTNRVDADDRVARISWAYIIQSGLQVVNCVMSFSLIYDHNWEQLSVLKSLVWIMQCKSIFYWFKHNFQRV